MIEAHGLTKRFGPTVAVDDLSFAVRPGVVTGFLGPNGSGKSTTMRLLLGLDRPDAGTATIGGRPYASLANPLREVGGLLDAAYAHPSRSARNHLRWLATMARLPKARVDEVLGVVGLADVADRKVGGYSLGMRQRLGLAGALLGDPAVLLLDEPANGLDPEGIRWIRTFLEYLASQGRTIFVSSHLLGEMSLMAESLVVIGRGRLIHSGDVASFVGRFTSSSVRVQSPAATTLAQALRSAGAVVDQQGATLHVTGLEPPAVGAIALRDGIELHELTTVTASLEDAFIEVTKGDQEFRGSAAVIAIIRAEWLKLRTVVGNVVMLLLAVALPIGFSIFIPLIIFKDRIELTRQNVYGLALAGLGTAQVLLGVIGVQLITQEFRFTLRPTFSAEPRRPRVMVAKAVMITAVGLVIGAIAVSMGLLIGGSLLKARDFPFEYGGPGFWRATIGSVVVTAIYGLIGLGLGALLRSPAAAITLYVVWVLLIEGIIYAIVPKVGQYLPFQAGAQLSSIEPTDPGLGPLWGGLLFAAFAIVLAVAGTALVTRRDA